VTLALLAGLTVLATWVLPSRLSCARWVIASPASGVLAWGALVFVGVAAPLLALLVVLVARPGFAMLLADVLSVCTHDLQHAYGLRFGLVAVGLLTLGLAAACARFAWVMVPMVINDRRWRRTHLQTISRPASPGTLVRVDHERAFCYCVPGRRPRVILSSAAEATLTAAELVAVVDHERAHLRWHHPGVLRLLTGLHRAFPRWPLSQAASREVPDLLEMWADDSAARVVGGATVARALLQIALHPRSTTGVLPAMTGGPVVVRAERLIDRRAPGKMRLAALAAALAAGVIPLALVAGPLVLLAGAHSCPVVAPHAD
jgi:Zn-dependent protease with chaperone function